MRITLNAGALMRYTVADRYYTYQPQGIPYEEARDRMADITREFMLSSPFIGCLFSNEPIPAGIEPTAAFSIES